MSAHTPNEIMTIAAARLLTNEDVCFVGIGAPSAACNVARLTHAPDITLIYESGTIGTAPDVLPLSIGDGELCETAVTTVNDFNAVDCPVVGQAVACGANSTVWRRSGGTWAAAPVFPMAGRTFTSCKLVNGAIWVAGDQVFARLDPQATSWTVLAARTGLNHLIIRAPNDVFATAAANTSNFDVVRYDGTAWTTVLSGTSGVPGGGVQVGARVVWGASAGALVEGR